VFNGDWKAQKMSKADYSEKMRDAESKYTRMVTLLSQALRGNTAGA
jgi:hypothetical protein